MRHPTESKEAKSIEFYKKNKSLNVPTCFDFQKFVGYAGEYRSTGIDQFPQATD